MSGNRYHGGDNPLGPGRWVPGSGPSQYGFSNQNNQRGYCSNQPWSQNPNSGGFNKTSNYSGDTYSNNNRTGNSYNNTNNNASFDNYYGMSNNCSSNFNNFNMNSNYNGPMASEASFHSQFSYGGHSDHTGTSKVSNFLPSKGGKKKGRKRPLPDDPKERKRIKRNNRSNKVSKVGMGKLPSMKVLRKLAAKNAPEGVDVMKAGRKKLRTLAAPALFAQNKIEIHDIPKSALIQIAKKHVSDRVNINSFSKKSLKGLIKKIDPNYVPPKPVDPNIPLSKKALRKLKAQNEEIQHLVSQENKSLITLSNPIKVIHTPSARKKQLESRLKRKPKNTMEIRKFTPQSVVQRYTDLKSNKVLDYNGLALVGFLRFVLFQVYPNQRAHCLQFSKYVLTHRHVLKLLQYEVKKLLDQRFGLDNRLPEIKKQKQDFLRLYKQEVLEDDVHFFNDNQTSKRASLFDKCIDTLTADEYPAELVPTANEFLKDPNNVPSLADATRDFKHLFITHMYETLGYEITSKLSVEDKIKFHLENPIIAAMLVEFVQSYETYVFISSNCMFKVKPGDQMALPPELKHHLQRTAKIGYIRNTALGKIYELQQERNAQVETNILDVLPAGAKPSTGLLRDFANFAIFSDELMSIVKYQLLEHTPYLPIPALKKLNLFDDLLKRIYRDGLEIWKSQKSIHDLTFKDVDALTANKEAEP